VVAAALVAATVGLSSPAAAATTVDVTTFAELQAAMGPSCADGSTVRVTADIFMGTTSQSTVSCTLTLDLNGHHVQQGTVWISAGKTLTVDDSSVAGNGSISAVASNISSQAGISTSGAALVVNGGTVSGLGGDGSAGVGGSWQFGTPGLRDGGSVTVNDGHLSAIGGLGAGSSSATGAGIGGSAFGSGGTIEIKGGSVNAWSGDPTLNVYPRGAAIGGGYGAGGGTITISGDAFVTANLHVVAGDTGAAGIGSGENGGAGGTITIKDSAIVSAVGGTGTGAGIGGGSGGSGGTIVIQDDVTVTATGGGLAAGIGGGNAGNGGSITIAGGTVTATGGVGNGGQGGAGIGGGSGGTGGTVAISGDATVTANGSRLSAGIGAGHTGSGSGSAGPALTVAAGSTVHASGGNSVGAASLGTGASGTLELAGLLVLEPPPATGNGGMEVRNAAAGDEVTIQATGVLAGPNTTADGTTGTGATLWGAGQVMNHGAITLTTDRVTALVKDHHYQVSFDTQGGSTAPAPVTVFAPSFAAGVRSLPAAPTKSGMSFEGWNTAADGSGAPFLASSLLPGSSADGTPVPVTVYAQWAPAPVAPSITGAANAQGTVGSSFAYSPVVTGAPAPTVTSTPLPSGLDLDASTGAVTGTPTASGSFPVTLTATNASGDDTLDVTLTISPAPAAPSITGPATASGKVGVALAYTPAVTGYPAPTVTSTPLPGGLALDAATGAITGTPTASGSFPVTLTATNASDSDELGVILTIAPVDPPPTPPAPQAQVTSPAGASVQAADLEALAGSAGPPGTVAVARVALQRVDKTLLEEEGRCLWLANHRGRFKEVKATAKKCGTPYYRTARGTDSWKYLLRNPLAAGRYVLHVQVQLGDGRTATVRKKFRVTG
jgi:uncharacterized repeat protein (TIGR02543 family)